MSALGLYGALATTAGVFVGFLNAYLVSRISGLKAERRRIIQRAKNINSRLDPLESHYEWRHGQIVEQQERREREQAEDDVDMFIRYAVGRDWSPDPDDWSTLDALEALAKYRDIDFSDLTNFHETAIENRRQDINEKLQPSNSFLGEGMESVPLDSTTTASQHQISTQWKIYDKTLLDRRSADLANVQTEIESLKEERDRLKEQYKESDPSDFVSGLRSTVWAIFLSIGIPLFVYLLHVVEFTIEIPKGSTIEPILVFVAWSAGLVLTYHYIRDEVRDETDEFPNSTSDSTGTENEGKTQRDAEEF